MAGPSFESFPGVTSAWAPRLCSCSRRSRAVANRPSKPSMRRLPAMRHELGELRMGRTVGPSKALAPASAGPEDAAAYSSARSKNTKRACAWKDCPTAGSDPKTIAPSRQRSRQPIAEAEATMAAWRINRELRVREIRVASGHDTSAPRRLRSGATHQDEFELSHGGPGANRPSIGTRELRPDWSEPQQVIVISLGVGTVGRRSRVVRDQ